MPFQGGSRVSLASINATFAHFAQLTVDQEPVNVNAKAVILEGDARLTNARNPLAHGHTHTHTQVGTGMWLIASSGGVQFDAAGNQHYFASGLSFDTLFHFQVYKPNDGFGNKVPHNAAQANMKAITISNGTFYWPNGIMTTGEIIQVVVIYYGTNAPVTGAAL